MRGEAEALVLRTAAVAGQVFQPAAAARPVLLFEFVEFAFVEWVRVEWLQFGCKWFRFGWLKRISLL